MAKEERRFCGTGRRKSSVARVILTPGTGKITVNGRDVNEYMQITRTIKGAMNGALAEDNVHISEIGEPLFEEIFKEGIEAAERLNVPLYCGEYGVIDQAPPKDTVIWFKHINHVFKKYNIGRAVWTYKEKDFGIIGDHYKDVFDELIANIFE